MDDRDEWQERAGISVLMARHDDDDDDDVLSSIPIKYKKFAQLYDIKYTYQMFLHIYMVLLSYFNSIIIIYMPTVIRFQVAITMISWKQNNPWKAYSFS